MSNRPSSYKCTLYTLTSYTVIVRYLIIKIKTLNIVENSTSKFKKLNLTTTYNLQLFLILQDFQCNEIYHVLFLRCLYQLTISYDCLCTCIVYKFVDQRSNKTIECMCSMYHLQKLMSMSVVYEFRDDAMVVCTVITHQVVAY